jgi:CRP-like cAMP-binding protein
MNNMRNKLIQKGGVLFHGDDFRDDYIYLLLSGEIIQSSGPEGAERPVIRLQPGSLFGFLAHAGGKGHVLTARAADGPCRLLTLDSGVLQQVARIDTEVAYSIFLNAVLTLAIIEKTFVKRK